MAGWVTDFAPTREELNSCVACGLCLPHCPTFRLTGLESASPRGRLAAMKGVADGVLDLDADFEEAMTFCLNCRACEAVCPSMVPYGRAMEGARAEIAVQRPTRRRRIRHLVLGRVLTDRGLIRLATDGARVLQALGLGRRMPGVLGRGLGGLRRLTAVPKRASSGAFDPSAPTIALLVGCVMEKWFSGVNVAAVELLSRAGYRVVVPDTQTCCGAPAVHDGAIDEGRRLASINARAFQSFDRIVATAAGCSAHLKSYDKIVSEGDQVSAHAADITEVVAELIAEGKLPSLSGNSGTAVVHDPCHLRHAQRLTGPPRQILAAAGYRIVEADPEGICCGAAGIYSLLRPDTARQLGERLAGLITDRGAVVATSNPGCEMQLRAYLDRGYRVAHPIELYLEAIRSQPVMASQVG